MLRVRDLREANKLSQAEIANILGISQATYTSWEEGKCQLDAQTVEKAAYFYGVTVDFLLGREDVTAIKNESDRSGATAFVMGSDGTRKEIALSPEEYKFVRAWLKAKRQFDEEQ